MNNKTTPVASAEPIAVGSKLQGRVRLTYLDGIRGLAALYVVLVHVWISEGSDELVPSWFWAGLEKSLRYGIFAVVIFVTLSGYCLMLPVVRSGKTELSGGVGKFLKRRIRRILPPYYASLVFCLAIALLMLGLDRFTPIDWNAAGIEELKGLFTPTLFSWRDWAIYLLFIQNFNLHEHTINGPAWAVATEGQIYIVFALLLLPLWRAFKPWVGIGVAFGIGLLLHYAWGARWDWANPWFLGFFALGMWAAEVSFSPRAGFTRLRKELPWGWIAIATFPIGFAIEWLRFRPQFSGVEPWMAQTGIAIWCMALLIYCTRDLTTDRSLNGGKVAPILRFLELSPVVYLGTISYSLYIIHAPIIILIYQGLLLSPLSPSGVALAWIILGVLVSLGCAYVFHQVIERPFLTHFAKDLKSGAG
ncbi:MAG: acyltransferase [Oculatellaceae cyanobacterium Prado106]|nr:acyltransferase [Oculatellaceae cyanobacterium Prado106]